jgi:hypothetical protein
MGKAIVILRFGENPYPPKITPSRPFFESPSTEFFQPTFRKEEIVIAGWCRVGVPRAPEVFARNCLVFHFATITGQLSTLCSFDIRKYLGRLLVVARPQLRQGRFVDR